MELEKNTKTRRLLQSLLRLEDEVVGRPFPEMRRIRQVTSYHCGPAVLCELLSFVGKNISQKAVVDSIRARTKIKRWGVNIKDLGRMTSIVSKDKFVLWKKRLSTISDISAVVNKYKYPVGVEWQGVFYENEDEDNGHYVVITRIDKKANYLRICDSYSSFFGVDRRFKIKDFEKRWWDVNIVNGRNITDKKMMFVIAPKGENWPQKLGMVQS